MPLGPFDTPSGYATTGGNGSSSWLGDLSGGFSGAFNPAAIGASLGGGLLSGGLSAGLGMALNGIFGSMERTKMHKRQDELRRKITNLALAKFRGQAKAGEDAAQYARDEVRRATPEALGQVDQELIDRGLYNTTTRDTMRGGVNDRVARTLAGIDTERSQNRAAAGADYADTQMGLETGIFNQSAGGGIGDYMHQLGTALVTRPAMASRAATAAAMPTQTGDTGQLSYMPAWQQAGSGPLMNGFTQAVKSAIDQSGVMGSAGRGAFNFPTGSSPEKDYRPAFGGEPAMPREPNAFAAPSSFGEVAGNAGGGGGNWLASLHRMRRSYPSFASGRPVSANLFGD